MAISSAVPGNNTVPVLARDQAAVTASQPQSSPAEAGLALGLLMSLLLSSASGWSGFGGLPLGRGLPNNLLAGSDFAAFDAMNPIAAGSWSAGLTPFPFL